MKILLKFKGIYFEKICYVTLSFIIRNTTSVELIKKDSKILFQN
jgi:hypothetical protein